MRNVSDRSFSITFSENYAVYKIMWKNAVQLERPQSIIWHMCFACWITIATNTHSKRVILIAFPLQPRLHEHASMLCYMYTGCLAMKELHDAFCFKHFNHMVKLARTMRAIPKVMSCVVLHKLQDKLYTKNYMADSAIFYFQPRI